MQSAGKKNNVQSPKAIEINPYIKPIDAKKIYPAHKLSVSSWRIKFMLKSNLENKTKNLAISEYESFGNMHKTGFLVSLETTNPHQPVPNCDDNSESDHTAWNTSTDEMLNT